MYFQMNNILVLILLLLSAVVCAETQNSSDKFYNSLITELEIKAKNNNVDAIIRLGVLYSETKAVLDYEKAVYWFKRAGSLGDNTSQTAVATLYLGGYVLNVSRVDAVKNALLWYYKAADSGGIRNLSDLALLRVRLKTGNWTSSGLELKEEIVKEVSALSLCKQSGTPLHKCK